MLLLKQTPGSIAAGVMLVVGCAVVLSRMIGFSGKAPHIALPERLDDFSGIAGEGI
jgi:hypothetical protein